MILFDIPAELKKLPQKPGVYIMKDQHDTTIYVGKAINLRNRVRSYFRASNPDPKVRSLAKHVNHFEYIITKNEVEALILECNLIKQHSPKYNIRLKNDKGYPYIKIVGECLPRVMYAPKRERGKASKNGKTGKNDRYFGPYPSGERVREILTLIYDIWQIRRCKRLFPRDFGKGRPCLQYDIGKCAAPCHFHVSEEDYMAMIAEIITFLQGKVENVSAQLTQKMQQYAADLNFEKAAEMRNLLNSITMLTEKQNAENTATDDRDVIAMARKENEAFMQVFFVREGKLIGREYFIMQGGEINKNLPGSDIFSAFIKQFYAEAAFIPKELITAFVPTDKEIIAEWLTTMKGRQVRIITPQKGEKHELITLAARNAALTMQQFGFNIKKGAERDKKALNELSTFLGLSAPPKRIEAYDISNIQGFESVGSMVVFEDGKSKNSDYRKFKIKGVHGPDDYASMEEVITRRFNRYLAERAENAKNSENSHENSSKIEKNEQIQQFEQKFSKTPDLLMIDGGKGQVSAAEEVLQKMGLTIPVCGMIKDDRHRTRGLIFNNNEITPPKTSEGFRLIVRIQDEVHRFAVEYHRKLRADSQVHSVLDDIPNIGTTRRKALMRHFKGLDGVRRASVEELAAVESMNLTAARAVFGFFRK
ncbi:MAG: excinuclease ABC subunit UvrC [Defluviitaleaceae bacterium]|nr:excinuclease ABC subunit UvrC [Defluviitaleaceae bacterium]